jgi:hypothetical protein
VRCAEKRRASKKSKLHSEELYCSGGPRSASATARSLKETTVGGSAHCDIADGHRPPPQQIVIIFMNRLLAVAFILFCLEIGLFLMFVPWSALWEHNVLLGYSLTLRGLLLNNFVRGGVSGLGGVDVFIGLSELGRLWKSLRIVDRSTTTE